MQKNDVFQTKNGLRVCYVEKPNFHKSYVGIGLNYGSRDLKFYLEGNAITSLEGTAHFIEHKLFQMPYGDAFEEFSKLNASANAYTDLEKTIYYFTTTEDLYAPLELLLKMYFTPYFKKEDVEKEKGIITSEIKMYD
ncbi:MAG: insulinase family protein, partial [Anaeroplasmataceae bacterium]|nr:insulinase family protein [Anaeroplasmataceae bacterium]